MDGQPDEARHGNHEHASESLTWSCLSICDLAEEHWGRCSIRSAVFIVSQGLRELWIALLSERRSGSCVLRKVAGQEVGSRRKSLHAYDLLIQRGA